MLHDFAVVECDGGDDGEVAIRAGCQVCDGWFAFLRCVGVFVACVVGEGAGVHAVSSGLRNFLGALTRVPSRSMSLCFGLSQGGPFTFTIGR